MRNFTSISDIVNPELLVQKALEFKKHSYQPSAARGKKIGLIFLNPSLRTRLSSQIAAQNLGAEAIVLDIGKDGWALEFEDGVKMDGDKAEHIKEAAGVMGRYFDVLGIRTFPGLQDQQNDYSEWLLQNLVKHAGIPIISLESATRHPLQSLADLMTINEHWEHGGKPKVVLSWAPHVKPLPQAVPNSFVEWMLTANVDLTITNPEGYDLAPEFRKDTPVVHDQKVALKGADFVYVKNWSSYEQYGQMLSKDESWTFSNAHHALTNNAKIMHCLPVRRGLVIEDGILDGPHAIHLDQSENRVYAAQAVLNELLQ